MRYLFLLLLVLLPATAGAVTGQSADFVGTPTPAVTIDSSSNCNNSEEMVFISTGGAPNVVFDSTATCTSAGAPTSSKKQDIIWFD